MPERSRCLWRFRRLVRLAATALGGVIIAAAAAPAWSASPRVGGQGWPDYQIIMWQDQTPTRLAGLARLGVTAGRIPGWHGPVDFAAVPQEAAPFRALGLRFYIENIATDFYSAYHRWRPDHPVTWSFDEAKQLYREDPTSLAPFIRDPSLSDPVWLRRVAQRLKQHVRAFRRYDPLFYNLADESGIGDLAASWDFDFSPQSLADMRVWLRRRYGSLAALDREWGSRFADWHAVMPMTTDAALKRQDGNFAAWSDFKAWMDVAFARAIRAGTAAVHQADPTARAAIEGAQIPGWGGYDYSRLADTVDLMEMYDFGNNVEIARSLNPRLIVLHTSSLADAQQIHDIWHELLLGGRGLILWDEDNAFVDDSGAPTARGRTLARLAGELRSGLAAQLIASTPAADPVAILYSPASMRMQWLLDRIADGKPWVDRKAETEYTDDNAVRAAMRRADRMLVRQGVAPRWLTRRLIEKGALRADHIRLLVLPHAIALSRREAQAIGAFAAAGGVVLSDAQPGVFDAHGRRLAHPLLPAPSATGPIRLLPALARPAAPGAPPPPELHRLLDRLGLIRFSLTTPGGAPVGDVDIRVFHDGAATIVGLQRDFTKTANAGAIVLRLRHRAYVYDLRHQAPASSVDRVTLSLGPVAPAVIALAPAPLPPLAIDGPAAVRAGGTARFTIAARGPVRAVHVEARAPDGTVVAGDTRNLVVRGASAMWTLRLAPGDPTGIWTIRLGDGLGGAAIERKLVVGAAAARGR